MAPATLPGLLERLTSEGGVGEAVLLSTCNRVEVCSVTAAADHHAGDRLISVLARSRDLDPDALRPHVYVRGDRAAVGHLFRVAAGLDSLVVGEPQILGQVKDAFAVAESAGTTGTTLNERCSPRRSASASACAPRPGSAKARCRSARRRAGAQDLRRPRTARSVLLVGAGEMAKLAGPAPAGTARRAGGDRQSHASSTRNGSRTRSAARRRRRRRTGSTGRPARGAPTSSSPRPGRAAGHHARAARGRACGRAAVIRCSSSTSPCRATSIRRSASLEQVFLYNIDDLQSSCRKPGAERREASSAEAMVEQEVERSSRGRSPRRGAAR